MTDLPNKRKSKTITPEIHKALGERLNSNENGFLGYWEAQEWVNEKYDVHIQYHWLRKYLITHFKTKLKSPRKSHYKKDDEAEKAFLKPPNELTKIRLNLNKDGCDGINPYFQDESRFGLMTHTGKYLTARGIKPIVEYRHVFKTTYLYGSYSPINGDSFVWEINGVDSIIFEPYLNRFSKHKPKEFKIVVIDNAGFHSTKSITVTVPDNIYLLRIPSYNPELNPCEQVWQHIKNRFKDQRFKSMEELKKWLRNSEKYEQRNHKINHEQSTLQKGC